MRASSSVATVLLLASAGAAGAQYRCDCTSVVDTCSAEVVARGSYLEVTTDRRQCARVDYFVDGQPFVSVVVDGSDREDWLARTTNPRILVQSCQVCRDAGSDQAAAPAAAPPPAASRAQPAASDAGLEPLIESVPEYPEAARARGLRGYAEVEFTVTPAGTVENARVVAGEPRTVFDAAALSAVARRRYPADPEREPQTLTERIEFAPPRSMPVAPITGGAPTAGPLNQCVREDAVYNYGEVVDVGLINACTTPVVLYGCAQGTGKDRGRWVCSTTEERGEVLVPAGDPRVNGRFTAGAAAELRSYTYRDGFSLTRSPNTQYWWIACAESDESCRSDARLWMRAVGGQDASVNPQSRAPIAVASSD